jgi:deoxyribonuclease V
MDVVRPEFEPDPALSRAAMESLQHDIADAALFDDDLSFDPAGVGVDGPLSLDDADAAGQQATLGGEGPVVAGVDQAFLDDRAVSAVVAIQDGAVVERVHAVTDLEIPYVPGLLAFREGRPILAALAELTVDPDLLVVDGSGRIHFREAGIATHVGVMVDVPAVGVAKNLLCGAPERPLDDTLAAGERVPVLADDDVTAPDGTVIGHAYQSRQYDAPGRHVNPLWVSPGHRVGADTATDLVAACCGGYKLPEPTRLADGAADEAKAATRG